MTETVKEIKRFNLNMHVARLLQQEPFFAALSRRIDKRSSNALPTAGVRVNPETAQFEMLYNPEFFAGLTDKQRQGVLIHEFYHLVFEHVTSRKPVGVHHMMWNFATDLSINGLIGRDMLPDGCLFPGEGQFENYPVGLSAERYLEMLKNDEQFKNEGGEGSEGEGEQQGEGSGSGTPGDEEGNGGGKGMPKQFDSHEGWGEVDQQTADIAKERLKDFTKKAAEDCSKGNGWGSVSSSVRKEILKKLKSTINWRKVLKFFIGQAQRADRSNSIKRINRRFPYIHAGKKTNRVANIAVSIDQSGSVGDDMLAKFFAELNKLAEFATFTVVPFDDKVFEDKVYVWKKGENKKKERVLCGGTNFDAPTEYVNKRKFDGHLVLTDGYAPKPKRSTCKRMWLIPESCKSYLYFKTSEKQLFVEGC
jgi:predicted metal-dependent peptidase